MEAMQQLTKAKDNAQATKLLRELGLDADNFTWPPRPGYALQTVMTALVSSGKDTEDNMKLLFGGKDKVERIHHETRMMTLMAPEPGTPAYAMGFRGGGSGVRAATAEEKAELERVQEARQMLAKMMAEQQQQPRR